MGHRQSKVKEKEEEEKVEAADVHASAPIPDPERGGNSQQQPNPAPDTADPDPERAATTLTPTQPQPPARLQPPKQSQPPAQPQPQVPPNPINAAVPGDPETPSTGPPKDALPRETAAAPSPLQPAPSPGLPAPSQASPDAVQCSSEGNKGCAAGEYCTSKNVCAPDLANGMACSSDVECASNACQAAVCVSAASAPTQSSSLNLPLVLGVAGGLLALIALLYAFCKWYGRRARKRGAADCLRRDPAEAARAALGKPAAFGSTHFGRAAGPVAAAPTGSLAMTQLNDPAVREDPLLQQQGLFYVDGGGTKNLWNYHHGLLFPRPSMSSAYSAFPVDGRQSAAYAAYEGGVRSSATDLPISTRAYDRDRYTDGSYALDRSPAAIRPPNPLYAAGASQSARVLHAPVSRPVVGSLYTVEDDGGASSAECARYKAAGVAAAPPSGSRPAARRNLSSASIGTLPEGEFYPAITAKGLTVINASNDDYEVSVMSPPNSPGRLVLPALSIAWHENDAFAGRGATATVANLSGGPQFGHMPLITSEAGYRPVRGQESDWKAGARHPVTSETRCQAPRDENVAQVTVLDPSTPLPFPSVSTYNDRNSATGRLESEQSARGGGSGDTEALWR